MADALFTKVQQRVLAVLFGDTSRSFYLQQIVALAGAGTGAVQRELARLESAGIVTATRIGRQKHFQANAASPVFAELQSLVQKTFGLADVLRNALSPLASDIRVALIFGSVAKGADTARSDIDLLIVSDAITYAELFPALSAAESRLGRPVNPTIYTSNELASRRRDGNAFVSRVMEQQKTWLIGSENDLAS